MYTEGLFFLLSVLVFWFSVHKRYLWAAVMVSLVSITRINGIFLVLIPLVEILTTHPRRFWLTFFSTVVISAIGLGTYIGYTWLSYGSPMVYFAAQSTYWGRTLTFPLLTLFDNVRVVLGLLANHTILFERLMSFQELGFTVPFIILGLLSYFLLQRSLFVYFASVMVFLLSNNGWWRFGLLSMPRMVLTLFPGFIVLGILMDKYPKWKWAAWALFTALLIFYTMRFACGRWVS